MLKTLILKEIKSNLTSFKFPVISLLSILLITTSFFIMTRDYHTRVENYQILQPGEDDPTALIPPAPLSILAKGLDENLCRSHEIRFGGQIRVGSKQQAVNNVFRFFTTPDLLFVLKVIMALAAMLFAFDAVSGEKETGTLKLTLANGLSRPAWVAGKWLGGFISFITPLLITMILGLTLLQLSPQITFSTDDTAALSLILFTSTIYLAVFYTMGFFISTLTHKSASALVISLFTWTAMVFILPNLGNILARQMVTLPSVSQLEQQRDQIWIKQVFERIQGNVKTGDFESNINRDNEKMMADYRMRFNQRVRLSKNMTRLSPASALTFTLTDLAGTGLLEESRLKSAVLDYKDRVFGRETDSDGNVVGEIPRFTYNRYGLADRLNSETWANIGILLLFCLLFIVSSFVGFLRYDVR